MSKSRRSRRDVGSLLASSATPAAFGGNIFQSAGVASVPTEASCPRSCGGALQSTCNGKVCSKCGWSEQAAFQYQADPPTCTDCGEIMVRNGACYKCLNCGSTSGCS